MPDGKRWTSANLSVVLAASYCYGDAPAHCERYGRLYTWAAASEACRSLGTGWRLPTMQDWRALAQTYGGLQGSEQSDGQAAFRELLVGGRSGLEMQLGGGRTDQGYARIEAHGFYWSASEESPVTARFLNLAKGKGAIYDQDGGAKMHAFSVRCVADGR
jgi:uncharacterized protein (TIGR02145 family)